MAKEKRKHHIVSKAYLDQFATEGAIFVVDLKRGSSHWANTADTAVKRDFNRIDAEGLRPDAIEDALGRFESEAIPHLKAVVAARAFLSDDHFSSVMNYIAALSVRNQRFRSVIETAMKDMSEKLMSLSLSSKEIWESQASKIPGGMDVPYEEMLNFHTRKEYDIKVDQTFIIEKEINAIDPVLERLSQRNWSFMEATVGFDFITSDDPATLRWIDPKGKGMFSPGHGLKDTMVLFPLSPEVALLGAYDTVPEKIQATPEQVALFNGFILQHSHKQIYARNDKFLVSNGSETFTADQLVKKAKKRAG